MLNRKRPSIEDLFSRLRPGNKTKQQQEPPLAPEPSPPVVASACNASLSGPDDPRVQVMVGNAFLDLYSTDEWMDSSSMPTSIGFNSPHGEIYMTKNRRVAAKLVADGKVVFTPLEFDIWSRAIRKDKIQRAERLELDAERIEQGDECPDLDEDENESAMGDSLINAIYNVKKIFPGCKLERIIIKK